MSDEVTCTAVLKRSVDPTRMDSLYLACPPDWKLRILDCRPKGLPRVGRPEWQYEKRDGKLHLTPSLHCVDTGFHTAGAWSCAYVEVKKLAYEKFLKLNPQARGGGPFMHA